MRLGSACAKFAPVVQTLVQTGGSIIASSFVLELAFDTLLIVDLGTATTSLKVCFGIQLPRCSQCTLLRRSGFGRVLRSLQEPFEVQRTLRP